MAHGKKQLMAVIDLIYVHADGDIFAFADQKKRLPVGFTVISFDQY